MLDGVVNMVKEKPLTTGLVVIGVVALGVFALGGGGGGGGATSIDGTVIAGPSDAQIAANSAAFITQQQSADARYMADLNAKTTLAGRAIQNSETLAQIQLADRNDRRRFDEAINLQSVQLSATREQAARDVRLAEIEAGVAVNQSNNARRSNRDNAVGGVIGSVLSIGAAIFGL